jgi:hypothetical protein
METGVDPKKNPDPRKESSDPEKENQIWTPQKQIGPSVVALRD